MTDRRFFLSLTLAGIMILLCACQLAATPVRPADSVRPATSVRPAASQPAIPAEHGGADRPAAMTTAAAVTATAAASGVEPTAAAATAQAAEMISTLPYEDLWTNKNGEMLAIFGDDLYHAFWVDGTLHQEFAHIDLAKPEEGLLLYTPQRVWIDAAASVDAAASADAVFPAQEASWSIRGDTLTFSIWVNIANAADGLNSTTLVRALDPSGSPAQPAAGAPSFTGLWVGEQGEVLAVSPHFFYHRFTTFSGGQALLNEHTARVLGYDEEQRRVDVRLTNLLVNGQPGGTDAPGITFQYQVNGDTLAYQEQVDPADPDSAVRYASTLRRAAQPPVP